MARNIALLTRTDVPCQLKETLGSSHVTLGVYRLNSTNTSPANPLSSDPGSIEDVMISQLRGSKVLATRTFEDERKPWDIVKELAGRYEGELFTRSHNYVNANFTPDSEDRILAEYFLIRQ